LDCDAKMIGEGNKTP